MYPSSNPQVPNPGNSLDISLQNLIKWQQTYSAWKSCVRFAIIAHVASFDAHLNVNKYLN
jgi:hypothetical protein